VVEDACFIDDLAQLLFDLDPGGRTTARMTATITRTIVAWATSRGWRVRTEARVEVPSAAPAQLLGFVDVVVSRGKGLPDVAIEIDSADKPWSVVKLQHAAAAGMCAVWVRWGDDDWAGVYDAIDVIQLRLIRRVESRISDKRQQTLWPVQRRATDRL